MKAVIFVVMFLCVMVQSCTNRVVIDTEPQGASVFKGDKFLGKTPVLIDAPARSFLLQPYVVKISKPGFQTRICRLDAQVEERRWIAVALLHPYFSQRLKDHYIIPLEEALEQATVADIDLPVEIAYGFNEDRGDIRVVKKVVQSVTTSSSVSDAESASSENNVQTVQEAP